MRWTVAGMEEETAKKRALQDAEMGYYLTQKPIEEAFVSQIQKDHTVATNMLSVFLNSPMAYTRQWVDATLNLVSAIRSVMLFCNVKGERRWRMVRMAGWSLSGK